MKLFLLELILIEIIIQVLIDLKVGIKVLKCRENQSESGSENLCANDDQLGFYIYSDNNKYSNIPGIFIDRCLMWFSR